MLFFDCESSCECKTSVWQSFIDDKLYYFNERELDFIENSNCSTDWNKVRIQAAIAIMNANYTNPDLMQFLTTKEDFPFSKLAMISVKSADTLIEELKKSM